MDQSESVKETDTDTFQQRVPQRTFTVEFFVGLFAIIAFAAIAYLATGLGEIQIGTSDTYSIEAEFDNISGLKRGATVEIAGVRIGQVAEIYLEDPMAVVRLEIDRGIRIQTDDIIYIRTKGIIGDRYVKVSRGSSDEYIEENGRIIDTESVVDIEDLIGKFVHQMGAEEEVVEEEELKVEN